MVRQPSTHKEDVEEIIATESCRVPTPWSNRYPLLIYCHEKSKKKTLATIPSSSDHNNRSYIRKIPELYGKDVEASFPGGWLLLIDYSTYTLTLWNAYSSSKSSTITLPPFEQKKRSKLTGIVDYVLLRPPSDPSGGLFLIFEDSRPTIYCCRLRFCRRGDDDDDDDARNRWTEISYGKQLEDYNRNLPGRRRGEPARTVIPLISCGGRLYAENKELLLIDVVESGSSGGGGKPYDIIITPTGCSSHPRVPFISFPFKKKYSDCDGELFCVMFALWGCDDDRDVVAVSVYKLNVTSTVGAQGKLAATWEEVKAGGVCKDKCLFVNAVQRDSGFCISNVRDGQGDRIYFLTPDCKYLFCYNMASNSISTSLPCPYLPTPWQTPLWVMPELSGADDHGRAMDGKQEDEEDKPPGHVVEKEVEEQGVLLPDDVNRGNRLLDVHLDLIDPIIKKLTPTDNLNLRASCRMSRILFSPKHWRSALAGVEDVKPPSAWLMFPDSRNVWNFIVPHHNVRYMITSPGSWKNPMVQSSKDGWMLVYASGNLDCIAFFNPFTKSLINMPYLQVSYWTGFTFSTSSPSLDDYIVVGIKQERASVAILKQGYDEWLFIDFADNNENDHHPSKYNIPVFHDGDFYFLGRKGNLALLTEKRGYWEWKVLDNPKPPSNGFHHKFLVECGGSLLSVFVGFMGSKVDVFKLDATKLEWHKVETLGNHVLYLSRSSTLARIETVGNRIYFPYVHKEGLVYYSLNSSKFYSEGREDPLKGFWNAEAILTAGWIEPKFLM